MLCAPADETSVSWPVAVTRSKMVVCLLVLAVVSVSWLVTFDVSKDVTKVVWVSALVFELVPSAVSVAALVLKLVAVWRLVL